jgi:hypothetical protein
MERAQNPELLRDVEKAQNVELSPRCLGRDRTQKLCPVRAQLHPGRLGPGRGCLLLGAHSSGASAVGAYTGQEGPEHFFGDQFGLEGPKHFFGDQFRFEFADQVRCASGPFHCRRFGRAAFRDFIFFAFRVEDELSYFGFCFLRGGFR